MRDSENVITYNRGFSWSANAKKTFLIAGSKGHCHGNQFLAKIGKNITNSHICDILPLVHCALNPCKLTDSNSTPAYERKTAKINVKKPQFNK